MADTPTLDGFEPQHARELFLSGRAAEALEYIRGYVSRNNRRAMLAMADHEYDQGNLDESLRWVRQVEAAVIAGDAEAAIYLSSAYRRGLGDGTPMERHARAHTMLERAAEGGYVSCMHALMTNHLHGLNGASVSRERFEYWARRAAASGSETAARALARIEQWPHVAPETSNDGYSSLKADGHKRRWRAACARGLTQR